LVRLLTAVAQNLGAMLENARLNEQVRVELEQRERTEVHLRHRTEDLEILLGFARAATGPGSLEEKLAGEMEALRKLSGSDLLTLRVPDPDSDAMELIAQSGTGMFAHRPRVMTGSAASSAFNSGDAVTVNDYAASPNRDDTIAAQGIRSLMAMPVKVNDQIIAVLLALSEEKDHFTTDLVTRLTRLVSGIGAILENTRLNQEILLGEELQRRRDTFVSLASHELRTPMTSIMGFSELLLSRDPSAEQRADWLGRINRESKRLTGIIDDLLDVSRIQSGRLVVDLRPLALGWVMRDAADFARSISDIHDIVVDIPEGTASVLADEDKLGQVLTNLLTNAVKYSPQGGRIQIRAATAPGGERVVITVTDNGIGIGADDQANLFTLFHRIVRPETSRILGTGLGLYIVMELVRMMKGDVWLESEVGKGSTFYVSLPSVNANPVGI